MTTPTESNGLPFNVWHTDGLLFDESPELFVSFAHDPLVFTVRGLAYFAPRFKHVGFPISGIERKEQFDLAYDAWMKVENQLLLEKIAGKDGTSNEYSALQAVLEGDADRFEAMVHKLEHRQRAGLTRVK